MAIDYSSAEAIIKSYLAQYGLESLAGWAQTTLSANPNLSGSDLQLLIADTPEFKARFPALETLRKTGRAISVDAYMEYEEAARQTFQRYGIPQEMYGTREAIADLLVNDVSAAEMNQRIQMAASAAYSAPQEVRDALRDNYGIQGGDLVAYWLDPDKAQPILEARYASAEILGAGRRQALAVSTAEAERLQALGITGSQAEQGFGQVVQMRGLEAGTGETATTEELVRAQFGDAQAQQKVERVSRGRVAEFQQGGGAVETSGGVSGLGRG